MSGRLYGIGVGPGDPELMTLKAVKTIRACDIIAVPGENYQESAAYQIALKAVPELARKEIFAVPMPMVKDEEVLRRNHEAGALRICGYLEEGRDVGFLTLGDVCVYSTYLYLHRLVGLRGYETHIINGIPSFCAGAAAFNMGLAEKSEQLHVLPASYQIEEGLKLPGTKVLMKAGKKMKEVKQTVRDLGLQAVMIENCGMENEKLYHNIEDVDEEAGYYSLLIVK